MTIRRKICLFGGTFDPLHAGHIHLAKAAQQVAKLDKVIFLPAACSPFKLGQQRLFTDLQRLEMLRLGTQGISWAEVSNCDLELPPPSWTWRLVEQYRKTQPEAELYWLMGVDQWNMLDQWARADYLKKELIFIVHHRAAIPQKRLDARAIFISGEHPASSSLIREYLQNGKELPEEWISPALLNYCQQICFE